MLFIMISDEKNNTNSTEDNNEIPSDVNPAFVVSVGAEFYNMFCKTGGTATPAQFKEFERNAVSFIFTYLGFPDIEPERCNFTTLFNSYVETLMLVAPYKQFYDATPEDLKKTIIATIATANADAKSEEITIEEKEKEEE